MMIDDFEREKRGASVFCLFVYDVTFFYCLVNFVFLFICCCWSTGVNVLDVGAHRVVTQRPWRRPGAMTHRVRSHMTTMHHHVMWMARDQHGLRVDGTASIRIGGGRH